MTRKFDAAREDAFLEALGRSGNLTLAAEQVGVSRSWVLRRRESERFDRKVRLTLLWVAQELPRRAAAGERQPETLLPEGVALTVRGVGGCGARGQPRRVQLGRARATQWTASTEARFLLALEASSNVKAAAAAAGRCHSSAYAHRYRWPGFAAAWDAALARGAARLEAALLDGWCDPRADHSPGEPPPIERMSAEQALELLKLHRLREAGGLGTRPRQPSPEQLRDQLARRLANLRALGQMGE